jgi:hypothetical protein
MPWDRAHTFAIRIRRLIVARPIHCTAHLTEQNARSLPSDYKYSLFNPNHCRWRKNHVRDVVGVSRKVSKKSVFKTKWRFSWVPLRLVRCHCGWRTANAGFDVATAMPCLLGYDSKYIYRLESTNLSEELFSFPTLECHKTAVYIYRKSAWHLPI